MNEKLAKMKFFILTMLFLVATAIDAETTTLATTESDVDVTTSETSSLLLVEASNVRAKNDADDGADADDDDADDPCKSNPCGNGICKVDNENRFDNSSFIRCQSSIGAQLAHLKQASSYQENYIKIKICSCADWLINFFIQLECLKPL